MIIKFNKVDDLVLKYVNGEDIDNIDLLEDDYKFMMKVINYTKDKKIYRLCSDKVKRNYEFVKFMIETFKDDKNFIHAVAMEYLSACPPNDVSYVELFFIMSNIFRDIDDDRALFYNYRCLEIYESDKEVIEEYFEEEYELNGRIVSGMGFRYVISYYGKKSDIITKCYAKRFLDEIFYTRSNITIENLVHNKISHLDKLKKIGIKNFILEYVRGYDIFLHDYIFANIGLICGIEKDINKAVRNWDNYNNNLLERKKFIFFQEVCKLIEQYKSNLTYDEICLYINRHHYISVTLDCINDYEEEYLFNEKRYLNDYMCLVSCVELAKKLYNSNIIDTSYDAEMLSNNNSNNKKKKIIEFRDKN